MAVIALFNTRTLFNRKDLPRSWSFPRCWVPVRPLRAIGTREGHVGRKHLQKERQFMFSVEFHTKQPCCARTILSKVLKIPRTKGNTHERRHDSSILGEPRPHRGLGQGQDGVACRRDPRWPMGLRIWSGYPSCPIHHQISTTATIHRPLPRQDGCHCSAPPIPPTCYICKPWIWVELMSIFILFFLRNILAPNM